MRHLAIILSIIILSGCGRLLPVYTANDIVNTKWQAEDGATIEFKGDSTFVATNMDWGKMDCMYADSLSKDLSGYWEVDIDSTTYDIDENISIVIREYSTIRLYKKFASGISHDILKMDFSHEWTNTLFEGELGIMAFHWTS